MSSSLDHAASRNRQIANLSLPTTVKVNRKYLLPDTLDHYNLPWEWDRVRFPRPSLLLLPILSPTHSPPLMVLTVPAARLLIHHNQALHRRRLPRRALRAHQNPQTPSQNHHFGLREGCHRHLASETGDGRGGQGSGG